MVAALKNRYPEVDPTRNYHFAIRACAGHSYPHIDTDRVCAAVTTDCVEYLSALCHVTQFENLLSIWMSGLKPGIELTPSGRPHVYFSTFLPDDPRFWRRAQGRPRLRLRHRL